MLAEIARRITNRFGLQVCALSTLLSDLSPEMRATIERARPFTLTSAERLAALCTAIDYVVENKIEGAFVECGVWKGGSSMAAAWSYLRKGVSDVDLFLFDTFEGMPEAGPEDFLSSTHESAGKLLNSAGKHDSVLAYASLEDVRCNLAMTKYPAERLHFIQGRVEETIPDSAPDKIAILRLDTDWYASTRHELIHLFPRLQRSGVLIVDDYGHWTGARQAVDEYFAGHEHRPLLNRIDYTGRIGVKP